jgi:Photosynthesis system II assembly factor YCF48
LRHLQKLVGRYRRRLLCLAAFAATAVLAQVALGGGPSGVGAIAPASAQVGGGATVAQTDDSVPLKKVTMIGSEADGTTWGLGQSESQGKTAYELTQYTPSGGWTIAAPMLDAAGSALQGFAPAVGAVGVPSPLAGQVAPGGGGILVGTVPDGTSTAQVTLVRDPGGSFQERPIEASLLGAGTLFIAGRAPLVAPLDEEDGSAGAFVVPFDKGGTQEAVLHWNGKAWAKEEIEVPGTPEERAESHFHVLGIGASSPTNAWLLVQPSIEAETLALYRRVGEVWKPVAPEEGASAGAPLKLAGEPLYVAGNPQKLENQLLTVTSAGVWVDAFRPTARVATTLFFKPTAAQAGSVSASWCRASAGPPCSHPLPQELPSGPSRSFAWATGGEYGERVITGLQEGVSLRLEGEEFVQVLALGGSKSTSLETPGEALGAAFSSAREGWLGSVLMPVHLTPNPVPSHISPWPVTFRHALFAVAPEPGAPVGSVCSEAIAVGDSGEVARYKVREENGKCVPEGWVPETLFGPGGRHETGVRLRAVAWPTPDRIYAVGDENAAGHPQMWLWRGETGLWEPDPAIPLNFRGSLLGVAFDPQEPARGYAVGSDGVLLRYGKTWTQEALPEAAQGASFTSIAFAGSEALVAYHKNLPTGRVGGLLVNDGSGWQVDEAAAAAMGGSAPATVAALPEGAAAVATTSGTIYERATQGAAWQAAPPLPPPADVAPGSLALYREGEALRVLAAGEAPVGEAVITPPPPGFPPTIEEPLPVASSSELQRGVVRQTADGWEDEQHELNPIKEPEGNYKFYDTVRRPDPIDALLVSSTGNEGWALGGEVNSQSELDTSDVERYEASGEAQPQPPGVETTEVTPANPQSATDPEGEPPFSQVATFAIGGNAQCAAPCAERAGAHIGPDEWLEHALEASSHVHGVRAFLYTGPRLSSGETEGKEPGFPFTQELTRYGELLKMVDRDEGEPPLPVFAAAAPTDLDSRPTGGSEADFAESIVGAHEIAQPLGGEESGASGIATESSPNQACDTREEGCKALYYSFDSKPVAGTGGATVRVIVLDDTGPVVEPQLGWLRNQLAEVGGEEAAIVIGNANLPAQVAAHEPEAEAVADALEQGHAAAYFYDSPEENVEGTLGSGSEQVKTFGSGTLGYVSDKKKFAQFQTSGFLLAQVAVEDGHREVRASLVPNIGELALEAEAGTLLRRSQVANFNALARRPRAGNRAQNDSQAPESAPYIQLPFECVVSGCPVKPDYEFRSSNELVGQFVKRNLSSPQPNVPELNSSNTTIPDPQSGLFCAYSAGTTEVRVIAGGLAYKLEVTVQEGSARRPCVPPFPLPKHAPKPAPISPPPPPAPSPTPAAAAPSGAPPPVPLPPLPALPAVSPPAPVRPAAVLPPFFVPLPPVAPLLAAVPPPVPTPARPTPPSGTSAVTSPVEVAEREEEHEEAPESVSNQAVAYSAPDQEPSPAFVLGIIVIAALAGASIRRRGRSGRREVRVAPATLNGMRQQQRLEGERRRRR